MFHKSMLQCSKCATQLSGRVVGQQRSFSQSVLRLRQYKRNHYQILGVSPGASQSEIKDAFVQLSKEVHPDVNPSDPDTHAKFVQLNEAYTVLSKMHTRKEYDLSLVYMGRAAAESHSAGSTYTPGSGVQPDSFDDFHENQRTFWDESIFEMRDRSKDAGAFYPAGAYYGIHGMRRRSNAVVCAFVCGAVVVLSVVHFILGIWLSNRKNKQNIENVDRKNLRLLKEAQERARLNGSSRQQELLLAKAEIAAASEAAKAAAQERSLAASADRARLAVSTARSTPMSLSPEAPTVTVTAAVMEQS